MIVAEAFRSFGWTIDAKGTLSVEWLETADASEMSAHCRLSAVRGVEKALKSYKDQKHF
jgi:hypothetical protein